MSCASGRALLARLREAVSRSSSTSAFATPLWATVPGPVAGGRLPALAGAPRSITSLAFPTPSSSASPAAPLRAPWASEEQHRLAVPSSWSTRSIATTSSNSSSGGSDDGERSSAAPAARPTPSLLLVPDADADAAAARVRVALRPELGGAAGDAAAEGEDEAGGDGSETQETEGSAPSSSPAAAAAASAASAWPAPLTAEERALLSHLVGVLTKHGKRAKAQSHLLEAMRLIKRELMVQGGGGAGGGGGGAGSGGGDAGAAAVSPASSSNAADKKKKGKK